MSKASAFPWWHLRMRIASHHVTWALGRRLPKAFPLLFVLGHPKSGTTWACQLLGDIMQLPFPRYSILPIGCEAVVHGHEYVDPVYPRGVYVARDGRDVLVSRYFFTFRHVADGPDPELPPNLRKIYGRVKSKQDVATNLRTLLEHSARARGPMGGNWAAHLRSFFNTPGHHFALLRYEDLLDDGTSAMTRVIEKLTGAAPDPELVEMAVRKYDFSRQQKTKASAAEGGTKFLRKGRAGDWRNHFTPELARLFDQHFGDMLVAAGYEPDRSWPERVGADSGALPA